MKLGKKRPFSSTIIALLVVVCLIQISPLALASADDYVLVNSAFSQDDGSRASLYILSHAAYVYPEGNGKVSVWFEITGTGKMDEIGSTLIILYERIGSSSWGHVKTYHFTDYSNMLAYNKNIHGSNVTYNGVAGRSYYVDILV